ncbi:MAG: GNAT family N-acetyltransferase [Phycisphaerales bacterium]
MTQSCGSSGPQAAPVIRETTPGDLPDILSIVNREIREGVAHFGTVALTLEELASDWAQTRERYAWVTALLDDRLVGYARAAPWKTRGAYAWTAEVGIYVHPHAQGRGIGRAMYQCLFAELSRKGIRTLVAGITLPNPASVRLHEAMGMRPVGVFECVGFKHGQWRDVGYWVLHFGGRDAPAGLSGS